MVCLECAFSHTCPCNTHTHTRTPRRDPVERPGKLAALGQRVAENQAGRASWSPRSGQGHRGRSRHPGHRLGPGGLCHMSASAKSGPPGMLPPTPGSPGARGRPRGGPPPPPRALPERVGAHTEAHSNLIHHRPHLDSPQAPRQASVVYPRSGILLDNEKGRATDTRTGSEESPRHHAARKKPGAGENVSHGSTHTEFKSRRRGRERTSRGDGNGLRLDPGGGGGGGLST